MKTNEVLENIKARRSVRAYTGQQVFRRGFAGYFGSCNLCTEWNASGNMAFYGYSKYG